MGNTQSANDPFYTWQEEKLRTLYPLYNHLWDRLDDSTCITARDIRNAVLAHEHATGTRQQSDRDFYNTHISHQDAQLYTVCSAQCTLHMYARLPDVYIYEVHGSHATFITKVSDVKRIWMPASDSQCIMLELNFQDFISQWPCMFQCQPEEQLHNMVKFSCLQPCITPTMSTDHSSVDLHKALRHAASTGHLELVKFLCAQPTVDPSAMYNGAVRLAASNGHLEVVKFLCSLPTVDPADDDNWAVQRAASNGHLEVLQYLCKNTDVDPTAEENWALRHAAGNGHLYVVKFLCDDVKVDPSDGENGAVRLAASNGHLNVVKFLCALPSVDPSAKDNWAVRNAASNGHLEVVKFLCSQPTVDPTARGNWALEFAISNDHWDVVKYLQTRATSSYTSQY